MGDVVGPSRLMPGVLYFDVARDVTDPNCLLAVEVFEDRATLDCQEAQPEVARRWSCSRAVPSSPTRSTQSTRWPQPNRLPDIASAMASSRQHPGSVTVGSAVRAFGSSRDLIR